MAPGLILRVAFKLRSCWPLSLWLSLYDQPCSKIVLYLLQNLHWLDYYSYVRLYLSHEVNFTASKIIVLLDFGLLPPLVTTSMTYNVDYLLANSEFDNFY